MALRLGISQAQSAEVVNRGTAIVLEHYEGRLNGPAKNERNGRDTFLAGPERDDCSPGTIDEDPVQTR